MSNFLKWRGSVLKRLKVKKIRTPYGSVIMIARWGDRTFRLIAKGLYGFQYSSYILAKDSPFIFIDIGANQGLYTLLAAENHFCRLALAFEPVSMTFEWLKANRELSAFAPKIRCYQSAVGDTDCEMDIVLGRDHSGVATLRSMSETETNSLAKETIHCRSMDSVARLLPEFSGSQIVVKIDVEGFEPVVISSLVRADFFSNVNSIYFEVDENWWDPREVLDVLASHGFERVFTNHGDHSSHYDVLYTRGT